jgi:CysZ protein
LNTLSEIVKKKQNDNLVVKVVKAPIGLVAGATYPLQALFYLLRNPSLLGYVLIPIAVNLVFGIALYVGLLRPGLREAQALALNLDSRLDRLVADFPRWLNWLGFLGDGLGVVLSGLLVLLLFLLTGLLLVQFGVILGAPWYGQLSEQLEKRRLGGLPPLESGGLPIVQDIWRALAYELKKLVLAGSLAFGFFLLNFVPGIGTIVASMGWIAIAALIVCLDFLDAPLERRRLRFRDKLRIILESLPASASFALVCLTAVSIPIVNFVTIPLCVAGGTLFFCDRIWLSHFAVEASQSGDLDSPPQKR